MQLSDTDEQISDCPEDRIPSLRKHGETMDNDPAIVPFLIFDFVVFFPDLPADAAGRCRNIILNNDILFGISVIQVFRKL